MEIRQEAESPSQPEGPDIGFFEPEPANIKKFKGYRTKPIYWISLPIPCPELQWLIGKPDID